MSKKTISIALTLIMAIGLLIPTALPAAASAAALTATPTASTVLVDGANIAFDAYYIEGNNYFKLRDIANSLSGSEKQFEVSWDAANKAIFLASGKAYTPVGGEMASKGSDDKTPWPTSSKIYLDGKEVAFTAYYIEGNNYFKLRDIGEAVGFKVDYYDSEKTVAIDTGRGDAPENGSVTPETETGALTKDIFAVLNSGEYHVMVNMITAASGDDVDFSFQLEYDCYAKDGMLAVMIDFFGIMRIVYKDGKRYEMYDDYKTMSISEDAEDNYIITTGLNQLTYVGEESGEFLGNTYKYDEYIDSDGVVFRYYVDEGNLKGIQTTDPNGSIVYTEILVFDNIVPNSIFEIPSDYEIEN
ncbi:MAG: copper amine oxidase N-terminal domain-containing protein [Oscillospiraceae bacterium]|nr:copper amine oxidase N-terminal domain-containing protein [Oscillospiraceae bacterium]